MSEPAGICVAGFGHWGRNLTRNFAALGHLSAVCESNPTHREACTQQYPGVRTYSEFTEALADRHVERCGWSSGVVYEYFSPDR